MEDLEAIKQEYTALCHAMQSGVAMMMNYDPAATQPKHLRVGVNAAMVDHGALVGLLLKKGIITELEYYAALRDKMKQEVESYEQMLAERLNGAPVHLA